MMRCCEHSGAMSVISLNIPVEQLRTTISVNVCQREVSDATIPQFMVPLTTVNLNVMPQATPREICKKVYHKAMTAIMKIEERMKKKHSKFEGCTLLLLLLLLLPTTASAVTKAEADSAYARQPLPGSHQGL